MIMSARLPAKQILVSIGTVGASPQIGEIVPPYDFFGCLVLSCPYLFSRSQVEPLDRFPRFMAQTTCFLARMVLLGGYLFYPHPGDNQLLKWAGTRRN